MRIPKRLTGTVRVFRREYVVKEPRAVVRSRAGGSSKRPSGEALIQGNSSLPGPRPRNSQTRRVSTDFALDHRDVRGMSLSRYYTPMPHAVALLEQRRTDLALLTRIERYLEGDLPEQFRAGPVLYLARHVATPNFETEAFLDACRSSPYRGAVGQDPKDIFVSHNSLKRSLGKLPVIKGVARNGAEIIEHVTVLDFNRAQGKPLKDLTTFAGTSLVEFHNGLFASVHSSEPTIHDDGPWVDRHHRRDLLEHYKHWLALFVAHGIWFEYFLPHDPHEQRFVSRILEPAFEFVVRTFGHTPLITPLVHPDAIDCRNWEAYPRQALQLIGDHARPKRLRARRSEAAGPTTCKGTVEIGTFPSTHTSSLSVE